MVEVSIETAVIAVAGLHKSFGRHEACAGST